MTILFSTSRFSLEFFFGLTFVDFFYRATPELVDLVMELAKKAYSEGNTRVGKHVENLSHQIKNHLDAPPLFRILSSIHDMYVKYP